MRVGSESLVDLDVARSQGAERIGVVAVAGAGGGAVRDTIGSTHPQSDAHERVIDQVEEGGPVGPPSSLVTSRAEPPLRRSRRFGPLIP